MAFLRASLSACTANIALCASQTSVQVAEIAAGDALGTMGASALGATSVAATAGRAASKTVRTNAEAIEDLLAAARREVAEAAESATAKGNGVLVADRVPITSGGTANSATGARLAEDLAAAQARDPRIGTTLPGANAPVTVTAESNIGGRTLVDTNQTARPSSLADPNKPTIVSDLIPPGAPNSNMANAHAEIGLIQQAYDAGLTQGQNMTIVVRGEAVCTFCRDSTNLAAAADRAGLNRLEVVDAVSRVTYIWTRGSTGLVKK